jgi:hypothetical protein
MPACHTRSPASEKFNLRWFQHSLEGSQRAERVALSAKLLQVVENDERNRFRPIFTGDKLRFYFEYPHEAAWTDRGMRFQKESNDAIAPLSDDWSSGFRRVARRLTFPIPVFVFVSSTNEAPRATRHLLPKPKTHPARFDTFE